MNNNYSIHSNSFTECILAISKNIMHSCINLFTPEEECGALELSSLSLSPSKVLLYRMTVVGSILTVALLLSPVQWIRQLHAANQLPIVTSFFSRMVSANEVTHTHIHAHMHACTHTHNHTHTHTHTCTHTCTYTHTHTHAHTHMPGRHGPLGPLGHNGTDGETGRKGEPGDNRMKADEGHGGPPGMKGVPGEVGMKGAPSVAGPKGDTGTKNFLVQ